MNLTKRLLTSLNGLHYSQDYLCLAAETFTQPLRTYLVHAGRVQKDVTMLHAFVGYCPVVFAFSGLEEINEKGTIQVAFSVFHIKAGEPLQRNLASAFMQFKRINEQKTAHGNLLYYECTEGNHNFTRFFHQSIEQLYNRLYNEKPGNVFLKGNLYKQVQIAYSLPRKISLITVGMNGGFNLFPTDLHGQVDERHYIISLRHAGKACEQVTTAQKILLSDVASLAYRTTYGLGKNHMQPLKEHSSFDFSQNLSAQFGLPLPKNVVAYKELQLQDSFEAGIHRILLFEIIEKKSLKHSPETLAHVHNVYATWRRGQGLPGNYLLR